MTKHECLDYIKSFGDFTKEELIQTEKCLNSQEDAVREPRQGACHSYALPVGTQVPVATEGTGWAWLSKLRTRKPGDPAIPLLGKYSTECKLAHLLSAALLTVARDREPARGPSSLDWMKGVWRTPETPACSPEHAGTRAPPGRDASRQQGMA